jgi:hypothetical protein
MQPLRRQARAAAVTVAALAAALFPTVTPALALGVKDDRPEARTTGSCTGGERARLKLKTDSGSLELEFEIERAAAGGLWRVALVHERRVAWKGAARATRASGSLAIDRTLPDLPGYDSVTVRALGPDGHTCRATATLAGR